MTTNIQIEGALRALVAFAMGLPKRITAWVSRKFIRT